MFWVHKPQAVRSRKRAIEEVSEEALKKLEAEKVGNAEDVSEVERFKDKSISSICWSMLE